MPPAAWKSPRIGSLSHPRSQGGLRRFSAHAGCSDSFRTSAGFLGGKQMSIHRAGTPRLTDNGGWSRDPPPSETGQSPRPLVFFPENCPHAYPAVRKKRQSREQNGRSGREQVPRPTGSVVRAPAGGATGLGRSSPFPALRSWLEGWGWGGVNASLGAFRQS